LRHLLFCSLTIITFTSHFSSKDRRLQGISFPHPAGIIDAHGFGLGEKLVSLPAAITMVIAELADCFRKRDQLLADVIRIITVLGKSIKTKRSAGYK
jgi:hypothetical protein